MTFASPAQDSGFSLHPPSDQQDPVLLLDAYVSDQFGHLADDRFLDGWSEWAGQPGSREGAASWRYPPSETSVSPALLLPTVTQVRIQR